MFASQLTTPHQLVPMEHAPEELAILGIPIVVVTHGTVAISI
jgi:hypothetical protein